MSGLPKGTADGQTPTWDEAKQSYKMAIPAGGASYPAIDASDTMRWGYLASNISGPTMVNEGTLGSAFDLTTNNGSAHGDPSPPDVFDVPINETLSGISVKKIKHESLDGVAAPDMTSGLTISGWIRFEGTASNDDRIIVKQTGTTWVTPFYGIALLVNTSGTIDVVLNDGGVRTSVESSGDADALVIGMWSHIGITIDAGQTTLNVYVNGKLSASIAIVGDVVWGTGPWVFGGRTDTTAEHFDGHMFDWRVAETVRDLAWFRAMYTARHLVNVGS